MNNKYNNAAIDIEELMGIVDNNPDLLSECFDYFIDDHEKMMQDIKDAIDKNNSKDLARHAHKFKGTLKYLAASESATIAYKLEQQGKNEDLSESKNTFEELCSKCNDMIIYINSYRVNLPE